jgi:hypothetical protein
MRAIKNAGALHLARIAQHRYATDAGAMAAPCTSVVYRRKIKRFLLFRKL